VKVTASSQKLTEEQARLEVWRTERGKQLVEEIRLDELSASRAGWQLTQDKRR
jgi:hypothetical protein